MNIPAHIVAMAQVLYDNPYDNDIREPLYDACVEWGVDVVYCQQHLLGKGSASGVHFPGDCDLVGMLIGRLSIKHLPMEKDGPRDPEAYT